MIKLLFKYFFKRINYIRMCIFEKDGVKCLKKSKYGDYCCSHKREFLVVNNRINYIRFTNKESDYLKQDLINSLNPKDSKKNKKLKKNELFKIYSENIEILKKYDNDEKKIILIQKNFLSKKISKQIKLRGEAFINKELCNNDTDFFSYETIQEIDEKYFFSYKDSKDFHWFFDIRSFDKLLEMNQGNPYNREDFPLEVVVKAKKIIDTLKLSNEFEKVDKTIKRDRRQNIKQKTVDLFAQIENFGYECQIEWFLSLNSHKLKKLYRNLEDIWNYRLQITQQVKMNIAPPDGLVFNVPVPQVMSYSNKESLQDLILNEVGKFNNAITDSDKKLGFMYFIIGLGAINQDCLTAHPWLLYV